MDSEEYTKVVEKLRKDINSTTDATNKKLLELDEKFIDKNITYAIGHVYVIADIGVRLDMKLNMKKRRGYLMEKFEVESKPDGTPVVLASGKVMMSADRHIGKQVGTFRCIIHGTLSNVIFKKYVYSKLIGSVA